VADIVQPLAIQYHLLLSPNRLDISRRFQIFVEGGLGNSTFFISPEHTEVTGVAQRESGGKLFLRIVKRDETRSSKSYPTKIILR